MQLLVYANDRRFCASRVYQRSVSGLVIRFISACADFVVVPMGRIRIRCAKLLQTLPRGGRLAIPEMRRRAGRVRLISGRGLRTGWVRGGGRTGGGAGARGCARGTDCKGGAMLAENHSFCR